MEEGLLFASFDLEERYFCMKQDLYWTFMEKCYMHHTWFKEKVMFWTDDSQVRISIRDFITFAKIPSVVANS